jgi:hypothetical protein
VKFRKFPCKSPFLAKYEGGGYCVAGGGFAGPRSPPGISQIVCEQSHAQGCRDDDNNENVEARSAVCIWRFLECSVQMLGRRE